MACGTFLMYPKLPGQAAKNHGLFQNNQHLVYYSSGHMAENVEQISYWLEHDAEREKIARQGCELVHKNFSLEQMFQALLELVGSTNKIHMVGAA